MGSVSAKIEALSPQALQALTDRLLATRPTSTAAEAEVQRPGRVPLSFAQEGLWLLDRLGLSATYNECFAVRLTGALQPEVLKRSIGDVIRRHESLRTRILVLDAQPCQVIEPAGELDLPVLDFAALSAEERESNLREHLRARMAERFDLESGPLYRASLVRTAEREHILCWVVHHMVWDGWSTWLFWGEVTACYVAHIAGHVLEIPAITLQYADFALRQRRRVPNGAELLTYWRRQLEGAPATFELPTDRPRQNLAGEPDGTRLSMPLPKDLVADLQKVAHQEGVTLYTLVLAAFNVVLFRWSGITDIVVGTPVTGRTDRGTESLIGYFTNMLVMRTSLSGDLSFQELLRRVQATASGAFDHQELPFGYLVSEISPTRLPGRNPLFQVCFALHDFHGEVTRDLTPDLQVCVLDPPEWKPKFELDVHLVRMPEGINAWFSYPAALFDQDTIERWMGHYERVLRFIVHERSIPIATIGLLDESERQRLLRQFQPATARPATTLLVHQQFEECVRRNPAAIALISDGHEMSFMELNSHANRLALELVRRGVEFDMPVGVLSRSGTESVIGLLAVLKAGGACMPLRVPFASEELHESVPRIVVVSGDLVASVAKSGVGLVRFEDVRMSANSPDANPEIQGITGQQVAVVTSRLDSSGKRLGAMIEHAGIASLVAWLGTQFPVDRLPQVAFGVRAGSDWPLIDLLAGLARGATLHLLAAPLHTNESIPAVPLLCGGPAALEQLVEEGRIPASVQELLIRGGHLSRTLIDKLFQMPDLQRVTYLFGYPESGSAATYLQIEAPADVERIIGRPLGNTLLYVVDAQRQLAPIGVYGELCIGGPAVARGYCNDPAATAERIAKDPFNSSTGGRIFFTGRAARWRNDGSIELADLEVQIPPTAGQINALEQELVHFEHIREVAVISDAERGAQLLAYVVPQQAGMHRRHAAVRRRRELEHVASWRERCRQIYGSPIAQPEPGGDAIGWMSCLTGSPFSAVELRESMDETIARAQTLAPKRVLEVGCGTGQLLHALAPQCEMYTATDPSPEALEKLRLSLPQTAAGALVEVRQLAAHEIGALAIGAYDTVILDSVVQCFPSAEYLLEVLAHAVDRVMPAGAIFIGGVRHLPLLRALHASMQLHQASDSMSIADFYTRVRSRLTEDNQLALSPQLFVEFARRHGRIADVRVHLRRGCHDNELTQFHYDVILRVGAQATDISPCVLDGREAGLEQNIVALLRDERPPRLHVCDIPNARLAKPMALCNLLDGALQADQCVGDLRQLVETDVGRGVDPELLWDIGERLQYEVHLDWSAGRADGSLDAFFCDLAAGRR